MTRTRMRANENKNGNEDANPNENDDPSDAAFTMATKNHEFDENESRQQS